MHRFRKAAYRKVSWVQIPPPPPNSKFDVMSNYEFEVGRLGFLHHMQHEYSAGGIIYRIENEEPQFLLIKNAAFKDPTKTYWGFPKGHLEEGEGAEQAALREVQEETGIEVELLELIDKVEYTFHHPQHDLTKKQVSFFLMRYVKGEAKPQEKEVLELGWFNAEDALNMLSFDQNKTLLKKALAKLDPQR